MDTYTDVEKLDSPSQEVAVRGVAQILADDVAKPPQTLTETQFRALRRQYFTVRHGRCQPCGHRLDQITEPRNNCEPCWWAFFETHLALVETADRAYQEQGSNFLDKMRGMKFRRFFTRYMSTKLRLQQEQGEQCQITNPTISSETSLPD